jgi:TolA-binding protein
MTCVLFPHTASAQIEVDVITTGTESASAPTTAPAQQQEPSAEEAAKKILPAPGTVMQSTENSTLEETGAVASEPSLIIDENQVTLKEGETTETMAVQSGAELLRMLGLQRKAKPAEGGLESEEQEAGLLFDVEAIRKLKGEDPTVVYRVLVEETPLPDPMIVPWIQQAKLLQERFDKAVNLLSENRLDDGRQELLAVINDFPESDHAQQAKAILTKLDDLNRTEVPAPVMEQPKETTVTVRLSPNIRVGTVIVDPENPTGNRAMIGGKSYKAGDNVYGEQGHRVLSISESVVQIEVEQSGVKEIFDVPVRPIGTND